MRLLLLPGLVSQVICAKTYGGIGNLRTLLLPLFILVIESKLGCIYETG